MTLPPPGWFPHPTRPGYLRFWDGADWSEWCCGQNSSEVITESELASRPLPPPVMPPPPPNEPTPQELAQREIASWGRGPEPESNFEPAPDDHMPVLLGGQPTVGTQAQRGQIVCQFCHQQGCVTSRRVQRKKRKTATRIVGGIATMGGSLALTGVAKKGTVIELSCRNCGMTWDVVPGGF